MIDPLLKSASAVYAEIWLKIRQKIKKKAASFETALMNL